MTKISLDQEDFERLVKGEAVSKGEVTIILQDIGFGIMEDAIQTAQDKWRHGITVWEKTVK